MTHMDRNLPAIRTFSPVTDIPGILSLQASAEAVDREGIEISEHNFRSQLELAGHDPELDRWVIADPADSSCLIASALIRLAPDASIADANITVHPDWRHQGLGDRLMTRVLERAHRLNADSIRIFASSRLQDAQGFLQRHGFIPQGAYTELRLSSDVQLPPVIWPFGYTLKPYTEIQDIAILTQAMNLSYIPLWGHQEVSEEVMASWLPNFNQKGLFLVFSEKGRVIGISRTEPSPERSQKNGSPTGYIDAPGIVPQHRRLDLYRALVLTGVRWLHDQGCSLVEMESWGDKLEVLKMYRELGFKDLHQRVCYQFYLPHNDRSN